jgi:hypothetical protein
MTHPTKRAASCWLLLLAILVAILVAQGESASLAAFSVFSHQSASSGLTVHEWGTFTSISGPDGRVIDWLPLTGSNELPSFVEHFRDVKFKGGLRGTIRMETPVLYFYSPEETTVSVDVSFAKGLITEWYPHADSANSGLTAKDYTLVRMKRPGNIAWPSVRIDPHAASDLPADKSENHYYAARQTASAPIEVSTPAGTQGEKFLFYRGVAAFSPPVTATLSADNTVSLQNDASEPIPNVILFERRGAQFGYRVLGPVSDQAALAPPVLDGSLDSLYSTLEGSLISQGLFPDEAHAMLETWKNSWFEEGARLLYIVPRAFVDSVLPLHVNPAPASTTRVFVGRLELITSTTAHAVESAFIDSDRDTLQKYSRFLEPIVISMVQQTSDEARQQLLFRYLGSVPSP